MRVVTWEDRQDAIRQRRALLASRVLLVLVVLPIAVGLLATQVAAFV